MLAKRIIPCLDVDNGRVVKGVQFLDIRDAGDPVEVARRYNEQGADEITFLDITATHHGRDTTYRTVEKMAETVAYLCHYLDITNDKQHVLTHGEAANNEDGIYCHEPYACWSDPQPSDGITRWDLEFLGTDESPEYNPFATD